MRNGMRAVALALLLPLPLFAVEGGPAVLQQAAPEAPAVSLRLLGRESHVTPLRVGTTHTAGGNVDVAQPTADTMVVTLTGVAVATDHPCGSSAALRFEVEQRFEVVFDKPGVSSAKLTIEGEVVGLLRSGCKGSASESGGCATIGRGSACLATLCLPDHAVAGGDALALTDRVGPENVPVVAGPHTLHLTWDVSATHARALLGKAASAEFAPDPALDPLWISRREPFHGVQKKDFGLRITLKVAQEPAP
jgi:hypothetical protein